MPHSAFAHTHWPALIHFAHTWPHQKRLPPASLHEPLTAAHLRAARPSGILPLHTYTAGLHASFWTGVVTRQTGTRTRRYTAPWTPHCSRTEDSPRTATFCCTRLRTAVHGAAAGMLFGHETGMTRKHGHTHTCPQVYLSIRQRCLLQTTNLSATPIRSPAAAATPCLANTTSLFIVSAATCTNFVPATLR